MTEFVSEFLLNPDVQSNFLSGLTMTLRISVISGVLALLIGLFLAFASQYHNPWLQKPAHIYKEVIRNTPLLIQLYIFYRGLQSIGLTLDPELCGILALSLYTGAYLSEVFRSGLLAIPQQQTDAGLSLGLNRLQVFVRILLPQATRIALPAVGNQLISLMKNSSLVAFITVQDLFYVIYKGAVDEFQPMEYFIEGALIYLGLSLTISGVIHGVEWFLKRPGQTHREAMA